MQMNRERAVITHVGSVLVNDEDKVDFSEWGFWFNFSWLPPGEFESFTIPIMPDGILCGWTVRELHDIAHGYPCSCRASFLISLMEASA